MNAGITVPGGADGAFGSGTPARCGPFQQARGCAARARSTRRRRSALGLSRDARAVAADGRDREAPGHGRVAGRCYYGDTWQAPRGGGRVHLGVDIGGAEGTPLRAVVTRPGDPDLPRPAGLAVRATA